MELIICSTPYQIFTAINMREMGLISAQSDLLIFSYFVDANAVAARIREKELFQNVKVSDTRKYLDRCLKGGYRRCIWDSLYFITCKNFTKKYGYLSIYDKIYYSFIDPSIVIISKYYVQVNADVEFVGIEDGLSDYYNSQREIMPKWVRWFKVPKRVFMRNVLYLYSPALAPSGNGRYFVEKLPSPNNNEKLLHVLNYVFQYPSGMQIQQKVLYFDQLSHPRVGADDDFNISVTKILKEVCDNNCLVKIHPRRKYDIYHNIGIKHFPLQSVPFELCCLNLNIEDKIFITNISSACFMPKIIFNKEPYVIFLFDINHDTDHDKDVKSFLERFVDTYEMPEKIFFVDSLDEMKTVLMKLLE